jgi:choline kinase
LARLSVASDPRHAERKGIDMRVIILAAGVGSRLKPFTGNTPKCLFMLGRNENILQRMARIVRGNSDAELCVVTGFEREKVEQAVPSATFVNNPFFGVTNSIASLWFARHLLDDEVIIINSDVVIEESLFREVLELDTPASVIVDSSRKDTGDYKVATFNDRVVMMSKELIRCTGEYIGITKLGERAARELERVIEVLVRAGRIDEWYENALVHMILNDDFFLNYYDVPGLQWAEVDDVDDWVAAREIHHNDQDEND